MTEPGDEFETFLKTRTVLPNGMSDDDKLEPPKALDAIVLKRAREAIRARQRLNRTPRWAMPVALAATILLCLSIVLNVSLNTNRPPANRRMTVATADKASPALSSPASEAERHENVVGGISSHEAILPEEKVAEARAPRPPVLAEAATPTPNASPPTNGPAVDRATALASRSRTPAQAPTDTTTPANSGTATASIASPVTPGDAGSAAARTPPTATPTPAARLPSPAPATAGRAPPASSANAAARSDPASGTASSAAAAPANPPPGTLADAQERDQPAALAKRKAAASPPHPEDPKTWLQQIAALRADGKTAQADAEMQRFRAAFPAYAAKPGPSTASEPPK
jgi:hypothetical protein